MKVNIITEGNREVGFGHIVRCSAIGQAFEEMGFCPQFIINGDETILDLLKGKKYKLFDWINDQERLCRLIKGADIAMIDSYLASRKTYELISSQTMLLVSYDDNNRIPYPAGVVVNGSFHAGKIDYPKRNSVAYLLGFAYLPLRKPFWRVSRKIVRKKAKNILVTFGGDDLRDMTPKVIDVLLRKYPDMTKTVVIGRAFRSLAMYKNKKYANTKFVYYPDARKMKELMRQADLAVSAAGLTLYELAATGTPAIGIGIIENQAQNLKACSDADFILPAGWYDDKNILKKMISCIEQLLPYNNRLRISRLGRNAVDGLGGRRIANKILEILNEKN